MRSGQMVWYTDASNGRCTLNKDSLLALLE